MRFRPRFSVRTLAIVVTFICVCAGCQIGGSGSPTKTLPPYLVRLLLVTYVVIVASPIWSWIYLNRHAIQKKQISAQSLLWLAAALGLTVVFAIRVFL